MSKKSTPAASTSAAAAKAEKPTTRTYKVRNTPILHDGDRYEPGSTIDLTDAQAAGQDVALVKAGSETPADTTNSEE